MSARRHNNQRGATRGTTLIEMILYLAIAAGLLTGIGAVTLNALEMKTKTRAMEDVFDSSAFAFARMKNVFSERGTLLSPSPGTASSGALFVPAASGSASLVSVFDGALWYRDAGGRTERLTTPGTRVVAAAFASSGNAATSTGIRISLTLAASSTGLWQAYRYEESFMTTMLFGY